MQTIAKITALLAFSTLAACQGSDLERGAIGGVGGYAADRALGGDGTIGAAVGIAAGVTCDDLTPGVCN